MIIRSLPLKSFISIIWLSVKPFANKYDKESFKKWEPI